MSGTPLDPLVADEQSRRFAQSEFDHPVVVVAGAGTGKTALLVARVAAWCIGPGWRRHDDPGADPQSVARQVMERVVAITFTEAAAADMAHRIGLALIDLADDRLPVGWDPAPGVVPEDSTELIRRARALSEESHRLVVSTIHAFCQRLLATYPLEARLHPGFEVDADGTRIESLAEEVVEEGLRGLVPDPNRSNWERLAVEGVSPGDLVEALVQLVEAGVEADQILVDPFSDGASVGLELRSAVEAFRSALGDRLDGNKSEVTVLTRDVPTQLSVVAEPDAAVPSMADIAAAAGSIDPRAVKRLKEWSRLKFGKKERAALEDVVQEVAAASGRLAAVLGPLTNMAREELAAARAVIGPLLERVQARRNEAGLVTFSDLLRSAERLLAGSPGVRGEVVAGIDHLLVDEFQDTDDVQCRLVEALALIGGAGERPALFIVGDPKQSIYAWRSADLAAYDAFVDRVVETGGVTVDLVRNFRSFTPILDEVERVVAPVMHQESGIQPPFQRLEATEDRRGAPGVDQGQWKTVEHWLTWPRGDHGVGPEKGNSDGMTTAIEAAAMAIDIRRLHDQGVIDRWGDVAVLLRVTTAQEDLLAAFREAGVPYEVARERDYYLQREVVEAAALVRCVLEPTDVLALLTVLRSDVVGVPDAALAPLWDAGLPGRMARLADPGSEEASSVRQCVETAATAVPSGPESGDELPNWPAAVQAAVETIADLRASLQVDPPDVFVEKIRTLWLAEVTAAARYLGGFRRARVDRFLGDLEATLLSDDGGNAELARFLRLAVEQGKESRVPVPPDLETDAVHVMTIHRAKGLDFEHVYVAQIHKGGRGGGHGDVASVRRVGGRLEYRLFGWATPGYLAAEWDQTQKTRAELVRLLYVAATRAKKRLVFSGGWIDAGREVPPEAASDFADLLGRRLDPGAVASQREAEAERMDDAAPHVSRVIPVFGYPSESEVAATGDQEEWSLPAGALERADDLLVARRKAAERMAETVFRSASSEAHDRLRRIEAEESDQVGEGAGDRDLAMEVGTAVHSVLENLDLDSALAPQIEERGENVINRILEGRGEKDSRPRAEDLLRRLSGSDCLATLESIAPRVVARELPIVLRSQQENESGAVISGFIDLVYRDPEDGRLVVADYKTDAVEGGALDDRVEVYRPQLAVYSSALREALELDHEPHVELWFLQTDRIVRI